MSGKVRCKICGAVFDEGLSSCPVCGVGREYFEPVAEEKKSARVRCKICGAEFDAGLSVCPVCGVGREYFEPVAEAGAAASVDDAYSIIVIGGGIAAVTAAEAARSVSKRSAVTIISEERSLPYNRPMLTKDIKAAQAENPFPINNEAFYKERDIDLIRGKKVERIDLAANLLYCTDGSPYYFDKLIFATGASCFVPPFKGVEKQNVVAIRGVEDARRIAALLPEVTQVAVIGGGVLGLEAAWAMAGQQKEVTILETAPKLFAGKISAETSAALSEVIAAKGIKVMTEASTAEILGGERASGIKLSDCRVVPAQLVIISCGVRANMSLAQSIGVECGRGIIVDKHMRTNIENVYACGDCAVYEGVNFALWEEALNQARVAGANAAGGDKEYEQLNPAIIMNAFNTGMLVFGATEKEGSTVLTATDTPSGKEAYKTYYLQDGSVSGVTSLGNIVDMSEMMELVNKKAPQAELPLK